jgi:hypothetical protein
MRKFDNSNYNKVSIRTDSTVKLIEQLSKLGVFKEKRKPRKPKQPSSNEIRQDNVMVGYAKSLASPLMRDTPALQQIQAGMTPQQIQDIQERNNAAIAALQGEIQQQRLQDIEAQQGQRFADIERFGTILNPVLERFRGAQEPGAGQRPDPFSTGAELPQVFDISEESFTQTLNEGGPQAVPEAQTTTFAETGEEEEGIPLGGGAAPTQILATEFAPSLTRPRLRFNYIQRNDFLREYYGLGPIPVQSKIDLSKMRDYYTEFMSLLDETPKSASMRSKDAMRKEMIEITENEMKRLL